MAQKVAENCFRGKRYKRPHTKAATVTKKASIYQNH